MTKTGKQGTAGAAARVRAKFAAREARLVEAVTAAERAWAGRVEAVAVLELADDRFRDAVAGLAGEGLALSEVAELAGVPIEAVRAARRRSQSSSSASSGKSASPVGREPVRGSGDGPPRSPGPDAVVQIPPPVAVP